MTEKLKEIIKREIAKLPTESQEAIHAIDWANIAEQIGRKYLLSESEINDLQVQTLLVLVGLRDLEFYAVNVENDVETTKSDALKIADEVFEKIFEPINKIYEENVKKNFKNKETNASQNINFILSGGSYLAFIAPAPVTKNLDTADKTNTLVGGRSMQDMKNKLLN